MIDTPRTRPERPAVAGQEPWAVIGGGLAGLSAALTAASGGHKVTLYETSAWMGGRARSSPAKATAPDWPDAWQGHAIDGGQHLLLGAYHSTLGLLQSAGVDVDQALHRQPLTWVDARGEGLRVRPGPVRRRLVEALLTHRGWRWSARLSLLGHLWRWQHRKFQCAPHLTVAALCRTLSPTVVREWVEPLCVAALNTSIDRASASVFLTVLADGVLSGAGASDLLIPRLPLGEVLGEPLATHLEGLGGVVRRRTRVGAIRPGAALGTWEIEDQVYHRVIVACTATEAARLVEPLNAAWASTAKALQHDAIVTSWIHSPGTRLAAPMIHLCNAPGPAQFLFDLGAIGHGLRDGFTAVSSAPQAWLQEGIVGLEAELVRQLGTIPGLAWHTPPRVVHSVAERRATFVCSAQLQRPQARISTPWGPLYAAGDYVEGPYPATIEGAVRSGINAATDVGACAERR